MRLGLLLICFSLLLSSYNGYLKCDQCAQTDLKGKVKKLVEISQQQQGEDLWTIKKDTYLYDEAGNLMTHCDTLWRNMPDSSTANLPTNSGHRTIYTYADGKLLNRIHETFTETGDHFRRIYDFKYDSKGRVIHELEYCSDCLMFSDDEITETTFNDTEHTFRTSKKAKTNGKLVEHDVILGKCDPSGKVTSQVEISPAIYAYDSSEITPEYVFYANISYDASGNMSERKYAKKYSVLSTYSFKFDNYRITDERYEREGQQTTSWTYQYFNTDAHGNYLKLVRTNVENIYSPEIITRQIEYYP